MSNHLFFNLSKMKSVITKVLQRELLYVLNIVIFIDAITHLMNLRYRSLLKFIYFISLKFFSIITFTFNFFLKLNIFSTRLSIKSRYFFRKCYNFLILFYYFFNIMKNFFNYYVINIKCYLTK